MATMNTVGVRSIKTYLSRYLRRVKRGEQVVITERGKEIALLLPANADPDVAWVWRLAREGLVVWSRSKPRGLRRRISIKGKPLSQTIVEDRG